MKIINLIILSTTMVVSMQNNFTNNKMYIEKKYGSQIANCGGDFTNVNALLYPSDKIEAGKEAYMYTEYTSPYEVDNGYIITNINFNDISYPEFNSSLCSNGESKLSQIFRSPYKYIYLRKYEKLMSNNCPIIPGQHGKNISFSVPNDIGNLKTKIAWFSDNGRMLLCLKISINIIESYDIHY
jgi:hypothetical protein